MISLAFLIKGCNWLLSISENQRILRNKHNKGSYLLIQINYTAYFLQENKTPNKKN